MNPNPSDPLVAAAEAAAQAHAATLLAAEADTWSYHDAIWKQGWIAAMLSVRPALKDLTVAAMRSSEHRAYRDDESRPWGSDEVVITRVDIGPTSDAAAAKRAWRSALPTLGVLGLTGEELGAAYYQSLSHP